MNWPLCCREPISCAGDVTAVADKDTRVLHVLERVCTKHSSKLQGGS